jgi:hypothetical protein
LSVAAVLQEYADRGVFRGFNATPRPGGRSIFTFTWLMQRPFTLSYDPARRVLSFKELLPHTHAGAPMLDAVRRVVADRSTSRVPAHKRLDRRRVQTACRLQRGAVQLTMQVKGANDDYAVRQLLGLVNDLFLELHEHYPDYLIAQFGLSAE